MRRAEGEGCRARSGGTGGGGGCGDGEEKGKEMRRGGSNAEGVDGAVDRKLLSLRSTVDSASRLFPHVRFCRIDAGDVRRSGFIGTGSLKPSLYRIRISIELLLCHIFYLIVLLFTTYSINIKFWFIKKIKTRATSLWHLHLH